MELQLFLKLPLAIKVAPQGNVTEAGYLLASSVVSYFCYDFGLIKAFLRHLTLSQLCCRIFTLWGLWRLVNQ
jgi:hypothetical protein